jgi:hypothetical protein
MSRKHVFKAGNLIMDSCVPHCNSSATALCRLCGLAR